MKVGIIDIGTNAGRLQISEVNSKRISKIYNTRIPLRLGDDVFENGLITHKKATQLIQTIHAFQLICSAFEVDKIKAVATSAMRDAENSRDIIKQIDLKSNINLEVISGKDEANFILEGFNTLNFDKEIPFVVVDVGGGSTEISLYENGIRIDSKSFNLGTIRLLKKKESKDIWLELETWIQDVIGFKSKLNVFGTGGNINKAHKILDLDDNESISLQHLKNLFSKLESLTIDERMQKFGLKIDRADVIVPALRIYLFILTLLKTDSIYVPKIGLADGITYVLSKNNL
jgi:exopolyphosphatase/guanosine-5'-triphosphate,3'-diphosphate pyrophosphatase